MHGRNCIDGFTSTISHTDSIDPSRMCAQRRSRLALRRMEFSIGMESVVCSGGVRGEGMNEDSRRAFLSRLLAGTGAVVAFGALPDFSLAHDHAGAQVNGGENKLVFFTPEEAQQMEAVCEQIIPSDDGPGAREAGAIYFIDYALSQTEPHLQPTFRSGLKELAAACAPDKFNELGTSQQIAVAQETGTDRIFCACAAVHDPWIPGRPGATWKSRPGGLEIHRVRECPICSRTLLATTMRNSCPRRSGTNNAHDCEIQNVGRSGLPDCGFGICRWGPGQGTVFEWFSGGSSRARAALSTQASSSMTNIGRSI